MNGTPSTHTTLLPVICVGRTGMLACLTYYHVTHSLGILIAGVVDDPLLFA